MFLPCRPCCQQGNTACTPGCTIPTTLTATVTSTGLVSSFSWTPTAGEISDMEAAVEGTYDLEYTGYSTLFLGGSELYNYYFPDPPYDYTSGFFTQGINFYWRCGGVSVNSRMLSFNACDTTIGSVSRKFSLSSEGLSYGTRPSVSSFCSGTPLNLYKDIEVVFAPDALCNSSGGRQAVIGLTVNVVS